MRYVLAIIACLGLFFIYGLLASILGWKHGGGLVPVLLLWIAVIAVWRKITGRPEEKRKVKSEITEE